MKKVCLIGMAMIIILSACMKRSENTADNPAPSHISKHETEMESDFEFGLYDDSGYNTDQLIHKVEFGEQYKPKVYVKNNYKEEYTFRLYFMVDYQITLMDGKDKYIDFALKPNESKYYTFNYSAKSKGIHDVIAILVKDPDNILDKQQFVMPDFVYHARRVSLLVSDDSRSPHAKLNFKSIPSSPTTQQASMPFITTEKSGKISDAISLVPISNSSDFYLHYISSDPNLALETQAAIFVIQDGNQLTVSTPYIRYKNGGETVVPLALKEDELIKPHNLIVGFVRDPYVVQKDVFNANVLFTNLITITK